VSDAANYGAATLTNAGATDAFLLLLTGAKNAATGYPDTRFAAAYGDASAQTVTTGSGVAVNRQGTGAGVQDAFVFGGSYAGVITFPAPAGALPNTAGASYLVFAPLGP
jgi:hypothetical protein